MKKKQYEDINLKKECFSEFTVPGKIRGISGKQQAWWLQWQAGVSHLEQQAGCKEPVLRMLGSFPSLPSVTPSNKAIAPKIPQTMPTGDKYSRYEPMGDILI